MSTMERKKMCAGCDGMIPLDAIICPYCNAHQSSASMDHSSYQSSLFKNQSGHDNSASLYPPAYSPKKTAQPMGATPVDATKKFLKNASEEKKSFGVSAHSMPDTNANVASDESAHQKTAFWATTSLCIASTLLTVGLLQLLFSNEGVLRVEMKSGYWFLYCLAAAPLFYLGLRSAKKLN